MASRIDRLEEKKRQLEASIKQAKAKESKKTQAEQLRRKVLLGEAFFAAIEAGDVSPVLRDQVLNKYIVRPGDRAFLGLAPKPGDQS